MKISLAYYIRYEENSRMKNLPFYLEICSINLYKNEFRVSEIKLYMNRLKKKKKKSHKSEVYDKIYKSYRTYLKEKLMIFMSIFFYRVFCLLSF